MGCQSARRNGYIVLWSDHGFMLGEKEAWSKMKPWYDSAHSNLIIAGPGSKRAPYAIRLFRFRTSTRR